MRLTGRRESNNIEDRRGKSITNIAGIGGIGGVIIIVLITLLSGGDMGDIVNNVFQQEMQGQVEKSSERNQKAFTEEENKLANFSKQILAGDRRCVDRTVPEARNALQIPYACPLHGKRRNIMWQWFCRNGAFLLFCRPKTLP